MEAGEVEIHHDILEDDTCSEDDGFEDLEPGGLRPNYKIPILLVEQSEEMLEELIQTESNTVACAKCSFRFTNFSTLNSHFEKCSGEPNFKKPPTEYDLSQFHSNALILALKDLYKAGTSGLNTTRTDTRLPFYMEPFAGTNGEHHRRIVGHLAVVTCRMCKCQYTYRSNGAAEETGTLGFLTNEDQEIDPCLIKHHVKLCPEYAATHEQFLKTMFPYVEKIKYHYAQLFKCYEVIRSSIYGAGFKIRSNSDALSWREMGTIYEVDENKECIICELQLHFRFQCRSFDFKLHNIEPENVDFVKTDYFKSLDETLDKIFFTRVTGL